MIRSRGIDASELWVWELPIRMGLAKSSLAINRQSWQWKKRLSIERCGGRNPSLTWSIWTKSSQGRRRRWRLPKWERSAQTSTRDVKSENIHDGWEKAAIWKKRAMSDEMSSNSCHLKVPKEKAMISRDFNGTPKVKALAQDFAKKKFE